MKSGTAMTIPAITVTSRWQSKRLGIEVRVSRVTIRTVSYRTLDFTFSRTLPQWQFLQVFQPATGKKKVGKTGMNTGISHN